MEGYHSTLNYRDEFKSMVTRWDIPMLLLAKNRYKTSVRHGVPFVFSGVKSTKESDVISLITRVFTQFAVYIEERGWEDAIAEMSPKYEMLAVTSGVLHYRSDDPLFVCLEGLEASTDEIYTLFGLSYLGHPLLQLDRSMANTDYEIKYVIKAFRKKLKKRFEEVGITSGNKLYWYDVVFSFTKTFLSGFQPPNPPIEGVKRVLNALRKHNEE